MEIKNKKYLTAKYKCGKLNDWKRIGVIHNDFDSLYEEYIKTYECQHCKKPFKSTTDRCLDHDHTTGLFRKIVCQKCNMYDSYIKYPTGYDKKEYNKEWVKRNREKYLEKKKEYHKQNKTKLCQHKREKIECICGSVVCRGENSRHKKTNKHLELMDIYMNSVD